MSEARLKRVLQRRLRRRIVKGLAAAAFVLGVVGWVWLRSPARDAVEGGEKGTSAVAAGPRNPGESRPSQIEAESSSPDVHREADRAEAIELPQLDRSDAFVRNTMSTISRNVGSWLLNEGLIRRFVAAVENIAEGRSPRSHLLFLAPDTPFIIIGDALGDDPVLVDPRSYDRYDSVAAAIDALDAKSSAQIFRLLLPLMQDAYVDLGYPDQEFGTRMKEAAYELLSTPIPTGRVRLIPRVQRFEYEERALEDLSDAQKHLLRMGPDNAARVQRKIREVMLALDPAWEGPPA